MKKLIALGVVFVFAGTTLVDLTDLTATPFALMGTGIAAIAISLVVIAIKHDEDMLNK